MVDSQRLMRAPRPTAGFTVVELLVASVVLITVLGIVAVFFAQQNRVSRATQERSDAQDRARLVVQLVTQDLSLAGSKRFILDSGSIDDAASLAACPVGSSSVPTCLEVTSSNAQDSLSTLYVNSLRSVADACRRVAYRFDGDTLQRYDQKFTCGGSVTLVDTTSTTDFVDIAEHILALDVSVTCSNGEAITGYPEETHCPYGSTYPRSAVVNVIAESQHTIPGTAATSLTTTTGQTVTCPADRYCYAMSQEVLMPNLKDD